MKKVISIVLAIVVCLSLVGIVAASGDAFVPSITYKPQPNIVTITAEGGEAAAMFVDEEGTAVSPAGHGCLAIVPYAERETLDEASRTELETVYNGLSDGSMKLPYDGELTVRELLDIAVVCDDEHAAYLNDGKYLVLTLDLGVAADEEVIVMSYVDGAWLEAKEVVNNGDGTVTITFAKLCPVAIAVKAA